MTGRLYNPYLGPVGEMLEPVRGNSGRSDPLGGILKGLSRLDGDDILLMMIIYLVLRDGEKENLWPLLGALLYCML